MLFIKLLHLLFASFCDKFFDIFVLFCPAWICYSYLFNFTLHHICYHIIMILSKISIYFLQSFCLQTSKEIKSSKRIWNKPWSHVYSKKIIALSFLNPIKKVVDAFFSIKNGSPIQLLPFLSYLGNTYIRGRFDIKFWTSYKLNRQGLPRTSNNAEAWHRKVNNLSGRKKNDNTLLNTAA